MTLESFNILPPGKKEKIEINNNLNSVPDSMHVKTQLEDLCGTEIDVSVNLNSGQLLFQLGRRKHVYKF